MPDMNARERALKAINHSEIFPVPVDVFENGLYPQLENLLLKHFGLNPGDHDGLLNALGSCIRWANPVYIGPDQLEDLSLEVAYPFRKAYINIWGTWDGLETYSPKVWDRPLTNAQSTADIHAHKWPSPDWFDFTTVGVPFLQPDKGEPIADWAARHANYVRLCGGWCPIASRVLDLFGMENGLINMATRPDLIHAVMDHISEFYIEYYRRLARTARGMFDILCFGDDFASQNGMLFSPRQWREYFLPLWKELFAIAHQNDLKAMMHSCGSIRPVIGDLIDAGLDILEVVQIRAKGMDAQMLKNDFGKDLVFYGGMDVQRIMPYGSPLEVQQETHRLIDIFGKNGGYILVTSHFLMDDVPYKNVVAMYDEGQMYVPSYAHQ